MNNTPHNFSYSGSIAYCVDFSYSSDQRLKSAFKGYSHWILQNIEIFFLFFSLQKGETQRVDSFSLAYFLNNLSLGQLSRQTGIISG